MVYKNEISTEFKDKKTIKEIKYQIDELNLRIEKATTQPHQKHADSKELDSVDLKVSNIKRKGRSRM